MMRIPFILAGVAAAFILAKITTRKLKNLQENSKTGDLNIDNIKAGHPVNSDFIDNTAALIPEQDSLKDIIHANRLRIPEKLEARYPGLKNFEMKVPVTQR
jgi:hypothetical protein